MIVFSFALSAVVCTLTIAAATTVRGDYIVV